MSTRTIGLALLGTAALLAGWVWLRRRPASAPGGVTSLGALLDAGVPVGQALQAARDAAGTNPQANATIFG